MIFFLDENFPKTAHDYLSGLGHYVLDIRGTKEEGADDASLFEMAQINKVIFLTTDRDFFHTIPQTIPDHYGIIVIDSSAA